MKRIPPTLIILGIVLLLGAAGDSDCGTGQYILARAVIGVSMAAVGCIMQHTKIAAWAVAAVRTANANENIYILSIEDMKGNVK